MSCGLTASQSLRTAITTALAGIANEIAITLTFQMLMRDLVLSILFVPIARNTPTCNTFVNLEPKAAVRQSCQSYANG